MKIRRGLAMVLVFLLVMTCPVLAIERSQKYPDARDFVGSEIPYSVKCKHLRGARYQRIYFGDIFSGGLKFLRDTFKPEIFTTINQKEYSISDIIPEYRNLGTLKSGEDGFRYELNEGQCDSLSKIDNDIELNLDYRVQITEDALVCIPGRSCGLSYSHKPSSNLSPLPAGDKKLKKQEATVIWDDDNDRDGIRTKQEVYYLKLQSKNDKNPAYKILEIPGRGINEESQVFGNIPRTWDSYSLDGRDLDGYEKIIDPEDGNLKITYKHIPAKVDFHVKVVWEDEDDKFKTRPEQVNIHLSSGQKQEISLQRVANSYSISSANNWKRTFQEFKYEEGEEIAYNLIFQDIDKYEKEIEKDGNDYTVTYKSKLKDIKATKTWIGGPKSDHKQVDLKLYRKITPGQEELVSKAPKVEEDNGKFIYTWQEMWVTDSEGKAYEYFVKEAKPAENYTVSYNGFNVTNTYESPKKDVKVNVQWMHGDPQETNIILYRKNLNTELEKVGEFKSDKDHLSKIFEKLPVTDENGLEYRYYAYEPVVPEGFTVSYSDDDLTVINTRIPEEKPSPSPSPRGNRTLVASKPLSPILNRENHYQYLVGYKDQTFRGENKMTREEVVVMFSRLLKNPPQKGQIYPYTFSDVDKNRWSITAISYLEQVGIIKGYPDGSFRPDADITRAEFAAMASKFADLKEGDKTFKDLDRDHWAYDLVKRAASAGWIHGYPDGTFKADKKISRAEVVSITNKMLNRQADKKFIDENLGRLLTFSDLDRDYWAYYPIIEATNGHDYIRCENKVDEEWKEVTDKSFVYDK